MKKSTSGCSWQGLCLRGMLVVLCSIITVVATHAGAPAGQDGKGPEIAGSGETGSISGTVTNTDGVGLANVHVYAYGISGGYGSATTNQDGIYTVIGLPTEAYRVQFWASDIGFLNEYYNDKLHYSSADLVSVTAPNATTGIDAVLEQGGGICGTVTNTDGVGLANVHVYANNTSGDYFSTTTNQVGIYTVIGLPTGKYRVNFQASDIGYVNEYYNDKLQRPFADLVSVTAPNTTTGIDAVLEQAGCIAGTVKDGQGVGIANVSVSANNVNGGGYNVYTTASGTYMISGVASGNYKVSFNGSDIGYVNEWYNNKANQNSADILTVTAPNCTTGIDAVLEHGGSISGTVYFTTEPPQPFDIIFVGVFDNNYNLISKYSNYGSTYKLQGLPTGNHKLCISRFGFWPKWYNNKTEFSDADSVSVTAPNDTTGIDAVLHPLDSNQLVASFGPAGVWYYNSGTWLQITGANPEEIIVSYTSTLFANFGEGGLWRWDGNTWGSLTWAKPENMVYAGFYLYVDFGVGGIWRWDSNTWANISWSNPVSMAALGSNLWAGFGDGGLWRWDGSAWTNLSWGNPENIVVSALDLYVDFGAGGLWKWDFITWTNISWANPENMVASGSLLYVDFGADGLWMWDRNAWTNLSWAKPENMVASGSLLYVDFGAGGLWMWDGTVWTSLTWGNPEAMVVAVGSTLYASFGAAGGLWKWDGEAWSILSYVGPEKIQLVGF